MKDKTDEMQTRRGERINGIWEKFGQEAQESKRNWGRKDEKEKNMELNVCSSGNSFGHFVWPALLQLASFELEPYLGLVSGLGLG